jgi:hypothetical protein
MGKQRTFSQTIPANVKKMPTGPGYLELTDYGLSHTKWLAMPMSPTDGSASVWKSIRGFFTGRN